MSSSSRRTSPMNSPMATTMTDPLVVSKGMDDAVASPSPPFMGSPPYSSGISSIPSSDTSSSGKVSPDIMQKLAALLVYKDTLLNQLPPAAKETYNSVMNFVRMIYGTEEYKQFYTTTQTVFNYEPVKPGTLGAYFKGCAIDTNLDIPHCGILCANALPSPDTLNSVCSYPIIIATFNKDKYTWVILNNTQTKQQALVFISQPFQQFSSQEKTQLLDLGLTSVSVYNVSIDGTRYTPAVNGFVNISDLEDRPSASIQEPTSTNTLSQYLNKNTSVSPNNSMMSTGVGVAIGIIIVVIVLLIVVICVETFTDVIPKY
jgi:hypothetical protein